MNNFFLVVFSFGIGVLLRYLYDKYQARRSGPFYLTSEKALRRRKHGALR